MQTSKYLVAASVLVAVILPLHVQGGPDNDEQAKMRAALRRALEQPNAPQSQPATDIKPVATPPPAEPAAAPPPSQPTPVAPPPVTPAVVVQTPQTFETVPPADDPASIERAREAMRKKMQELQASPSAPTTAPAFTPATPVAPPPPAPGSAPVTASATKPTPTPAATPVVTSSYKPIDAPNSPFSSAKQAKLANLLARYRADAITAQEYHAQRAAIIAEP